MATRDEISLDNKKRYSDEFARGVLEFFREYCATLKGSMRWSRIRRSVGTYYSENIGDETELQSGGSQGELTLLKPNEYRSLTQSQLNIITQNAPAYEVTPKRNDVKSVEAAKLGQGLLDYYLEFKALGSHRVRWAEIAAVASEAFLHAPWDDSIGAPALATAEGDGTQSSGGMLFEITGPWDCAYDGVTADKTRPRRYGVRVPRNRYDLIAKHKKHKAAILAAPAWKEGLEESDGVSALVECGKSEDYVAVIYYYAERSADCPTGRMAQVLDERVVLEDLDLEYERCAVFRLAPCERIVGLGAHTNNFELLPVVEAYSAELSIILSNHATFGGQMVAYPKGSGVKPHQLGNGMTGLEYDSMGGTVPPPTALTLCQTPKEIFDAAALLRSTGERLLAVSAASRGESVEGDSGSKSALLAAAAEQFATSFHQSLSRAEKDLGQHIIDTETRKAKTARLVMIMGARGAYAAREYVGSDLNGIAAVSVRTRSPMLDTPEGRERLMPHLLKAQGGLVTGDQIIEFATTGRYTPQYEGTLADMPLIERENEELLDPNKPLPLVAPTDQHAEHYKGHAKLYADPEVRRNPALMERIDEHQLMHELRLQPTLPDGSPNPDYAGEYALLITGQKPLPPKGALQQPPAGGGGPAAPLGPKPAATPALPPGAPVPGGPPGPPVGPSQPNMPAMPVNPVSGRPPMPPPTQAQGA